MEFFTHSIKALLHISYEPMMRFFEAVTKRRIKRIYKDAITTTTTEGPIHSESSG